MHRALAVAQAHDEGAGTFFALDVGVRAAEVGEDAFHGLRHGCRRHAEEVGGDLDDFVLRIGVVGAGGFVYQRHGGCERKCAAGAFYERVTAGQFLVGHLYLLQNVQAPCSAKITLAI